MSNFLAKFGPMMNNGNGYGNPSLNLLKKTMQKKVEQMVKNTGRCVNQIN